MGHKMKVGDLEVDGQYKRLDTTPPKGSKAVLSGAVEATVDATQQPLLKVRGFLSMIGDIPKVLRPEAQIVLYNLFMCFQKAGTVQEGLIGDLLWGFEHKTEEGFGGIPPQCVASGLSQLEKAGYVKFQAPDNSYVDFSSDLIGKAWVRYQEPLLKMIYEEKT